MAETRLRLLVADDTADIVGALRRLPEMTADVWKARTGSEAVQLLHTQRFDAALIDANLAGPPAPQVYAELRSTRGSADLPVIFVSPLGALDQRVATLPQSRVIAWPMDEESLRQNLQDLLAMRPRVVRATAGQLTMQDALQDVASTLAALADADNLRPEQKQAVQQAQQRLDGVMGVRQTAGGGV